jgi:hypothetical protein
MYCQKVEHLSTHSIDAVFFTPCFLLTSIIDGAVFLPLLAFLPSGSWHEAKK